MARLLLDENMPRLFSRWLTGHDVRTVQQMGWAGLRNGTLLRRAAGEFDVLITLDRGIPFQQSIANLRIAVLLIHALSNKLDDLEPIVEAVMAAIPQCRPGTVSSVGDGRPR